MPTKRIFEYVNAAGEVLNYKFENNKCIGFFKNGEKTTGIDDDKELTPAFENGLHTAGFREV